MQHKAMKQATGTNAHKKWRNCNGQSIESDRARHGAVRRQGRARLGRRRTNTYTRDTSKAAAGAPTTTARAACRSLLRRRRRRRRCVVVRVRRQVWQLGERRRRSSEAAARRRVRLNRVATCAAYGACVHACVGGRSVCVRHLRVAVATRGQQHTQRQRDARSKHDTATRTHAPQALRLCGRRRKRVDAAVDAAVKVEEGQDFDAERLAQVRLVLVKVDL